MSYHQSNVVFQISQIDCIAPYNLKTVSNHSLIDLFRFSTKISQNPFKHGETDKLSFFRSFLSYRFSSLPRPLVSKFYWKLSHKNEHSNLSQFCWRLEITAENPFFHKLNSWPPEVQFSFVVHSRLGLMNHFNFSFNIPIS